MNNTAIRLRGQINSLEIKKESILESRNKDGIIEYLDKNGFLEYLNKEIEIYAIDKAIEVLNDEILKILEGAK